MTPIKVALSRSCDACGTPMTDHDEFLCPRCKSKPEKIHMRFTHNERTGWYEGSEGLSFKFNYNEREKDGQRDSVQTVPISCRACDLDFTEAHLTTLFKRFGQNPEEANAIMAGEIHSDLQHYYGTEQYHRHLNGCLLTDGAKAFADLAGAYWLFDIIASVQGNVKAVTAEPKQFWTIVRFNEEADVFCWDGNMADDRAKKVWLNPCNLDNWRGHLHYHQHIEYTDLPFRKFELYAFEGGLSPDGPVQRIIMLPSEN